VASAVVADSDTKAQQHSRPRAAQTPGYGMPTFTVRQGKRYRATILLNWVERLASNEIVAQKFRDLGFSDVRVSGRGGTRSAQAIWPAQNASAEIPPQIKSIEEVEA
jgi:hypothetical protein